ncbi:MAG: cyclic nucleotide-binding domain-containing protein [Elusimicrobia bacterium]|nr:cyclic nucleotide-binding domain-containing protein [Elusimicrobiota bacterium]
MLSTMEKILHMKKFPIFGNLSGEELLAISKITFEKTVEPDTVIFTEGSQQSGLHIVVSGKVEISRSSGGNKIVLAIFGPSECFGELSLFVDLPHTAAARALEKTVCLLIAQEPFLDLVYEQPTVAVGIIKVFCRRLQATNARL